jgi:hypothetical protein
MTEHAPYNLIISYLQQKKAYGVPVRCCGKRLDTFIHSGWSLYADQPEVAHQHREGSPRLHIPRSDEVKGSPYPAISYRLSIQGIKRYVNHDWRTRLIG